jgi:hypothetical protein
VCLHRPIYTVIMDVIAEEAELAKTISPIIAARQAKL